MQIAGKHVAHVEAHGSVMDLSTAETMHALIEEAIVEHKSVSAAISDEALRKEFDATFSEDLSRAQAVLTICEERAEFLRRK